MVLLVKKLQRSELFGVQNPTDAALGTELRQHDALVDLAGTPRDGAHLLLIELIGAHRRGAFILQRPHLLDERVHQEPGILLKRLDPLPLLWSEPDFVRVHQDHPGHRTVCGRLLIGSMLSMAVTRILGESHSG
jgi:hypothetical protein